MITRRNFIQQASLAAGAVLSTPLWAKPHLTAGNLQISLAEWSLHRTIRAGKLDHLDFPAKAREFGVSAVEYVNGLFGTKTLDFKQAATDKKYMSELLKRSMNAGVVNHLLMVDEEGSLAGTDAKERSKAIENHHKWIDAAKYLGCKTVRVNLHGQGDPQEKHKASVESLTKLGEYAAPMDINIVVENHGSDSSKGFWVAAVMREVNRPNVGTLPDFGNFCINHPWGTTQEGCSDEYDRYKGIEELLPFAKGVSAKSYDFDANGMQPKIDYARLMKIVKASGFSGYIGIEFEGINQSEEEGIRKTKALLERFI
jgi:sugar phosphate isomerase/epimerase